MYEGTRSRALGCPVRRFEALPRRRVQPRWSTIRTREEDSVCVVATTMTTCPGNQRPTRILDFRSLAGCGAIDSRFKLRIIRFRHSRFVTRQRSSTNSLFHICYMTSNARYSSPLLHIPRLFPILIIIKRRPCLHARSILDLGMRTDKVHLALFHVP